MNAASQTDRIERKVVINTPRARVWRALTNAEEFGTWFGVNFQGQTFTPGQHVSGHMNGSAGCGHEGALISIVVDRVEPENLFSYRWLPYPVDSAADANIETPKTLVTFTLKDAPEGTLLTVVESGFDGIPPDRRLNAFRANSNGWDAQIANVVRYVTA